MKTKTKKQLEEEIEIIEVTAMWIDKKRCWINGKYLYVKDIHAYDTDIGKKSKTGFGIEKYRILGKCPTKYTYRLLCRKHHGFDNPDYFSFYNHENKEVF